MFSLKESDRITKAKFAIRNPQFEIIFAISQSEIRNFSILFLDMEPSDG